MIGVVIALLVGILCILLGRAVYRGKLSLVQDYHTRQVREADKVAFGKGVGRGIILCGCGILAFSILAIVAICAGRQKFFLYGLVGLVLTMVGGLRIVFFVMRKYNGGVFG